MTLLQLLTYLGYAEIVIESISNLIDLDREITPDDILAITARMDAVDESFAEMLKRKALEAAE